MKSKLKGVDLTEQFAGVTSAINSGKAGVKEYKESISQMYNEVKLLYDFASKRENSGAMKALASFDTGQLSKVVQQLQIVKNQEAAIFTAREDALKQIALIQNQSTVSDKRINSILSARGLKVPSSRQVGQLMGLDETASKEVESQLNLYGRLCTYAKELLDTKENLGQIDSSQSRQKQLSVAGDQLRINTQLLDVYRQISTVENTIRGKTGIKSSQMLSKNILGTLDESSLQKAVKDSENIYNTIFTTPAQKTFDEVKQKLNILIDNELGKVQRALDKVKEKTSAKAGTGTGGGASTGAEIGGGSGAGAGSGSETSSATTEQINALSTQLADISDAINDVKTEITKLGSNTSGFDNISEQVGKLDSVLGSVLQKIETLQYFSSGSKIAYHGGNLDDLSNTHKAEAWADRISGLRFGEVGTWGTGTYVTTNADDLQERESFYAIDLSKYNLFINKTNEEAQKLNSFLTNLEKFVLASSKFRGFDDSLKDIDAKSLFSEYSQIFEDVQIDFNQFEQFINDMKKLVSKSNFTSEGEIGIPESDELYYSDSIPTRFMKMLGYQGVNNSGLSEYDSVDHGSVIYDLHTIEPYVKKFIDFNQLLEYNQKLMIENSKIDPLASVDENSVAEDALESAEKAVLEPKLSTENNSTTAQSGRAFNGEISDFSDLQEAINKVDQSIIQKNNDLVKEATIANRTIGIEIPLFEKLKNKIEEVRAAIKDKTEELFKEGSAADSVIQGEITAFQPLEALITNISNGLSNIVTQLSQLSASGLTNIPINVYPSGQVGSRIQDIDLAWEEANIENEKFDNAKKQQEEAQKEAQHLKEVKKQYAELMRIVKEYEQVRLRIAKGKDVSGDEQLKTQLTKDLAAQRKHIKQQQLFDNDLNDTYVNYLKSIKSKEKTALSGQKTQKQNELKKYNEKQIDKFTAKQDAAINKTEEYSNLIKELNGKLQELQKYESLDLLDPQNITDVEKLKTEISKLFTELTNPDFNIIDVEKIQSAQTSWENWRKNNTKANGQFKTELDAISAKYKQFATATKVSQKDWEELNAEVVKLKNNITKAGKTGQSFFDIWKGRMKSMFAWLSSFVGFQEVIQVVRTGVGYVKDLDAAMTDLRKVSDASAKELDDFQKSAAGIASDLAAATNTVVQATTEWSRLGYAIDEATKLAEASTIYANVGDIDATTASTDLVSAMKAFDIEAKNAMKIVDSLNEIGNNYAVSSAQLGEILEKSSSALAVSGDSIDQVIAMGAAMNEIVQDSSITGTTLKMLSLRIRGASTEIEEMGESTDGMAESTSKLREQIKALTNTNGTGGFDIMLDDKTFKTTYDIMKGISKEWANMDQIDQSALLELIAGKNRAQGAAALIKNFSKAEDALKDSLNSAGSAAEENERFMESIEGHLNVLSNEYQRLWTEGINKDFINFWIDVGTAIMEVVNNVGLLNTAIGGLSLAAGIMMTKDGNGFFSKEGIRQAFGGSGAGQAGHGWFTRLEDLSARIDVYNKRIQQSNGGHIIFANNLADVDSKLSKYLLSLNGATASTKGYIGSLIKLTAQEAITTAATTALNAALTMGIGLLIEGAVIGISKFIEFLDSIDISAAEAAEQTKGLNQSLRELQNTINDGFQSIDDLGARFVKLSEGVSTLGTNISLTDDEYKEYLKFGNQLAELTPDLVSHWDAQGNAILGVVTNVNQLTDAYKKEIQEKAKLYLLNGKDEEGNERRAIYANYKDIFDYSSTGKGTEREILSKLTSSDLSSGDLNDLLFPQEYFEDWGKYLPYREILQEHGIVNVTEENLVKVRELFQSSLDLLNDELQINATAIAQDAQAIANSQDRYWNLDESLQTAMGSFLSGLSPEVITGLELTSETATESFVRGILASLSNLETTELDDALLGLFSIDLSDKSIPEAQELVNGYISILISEFKRLNPDATITASDLLAQFGLTDVNTLAESYQANLDNWSAQGAKVTTASESVIRTAIESFANKFSINTQDEIALFNDCMEEAKNNYQQAMSLYLEKIQNSTDEKSYIERISQIENLSKGMEQLSKIYLDIKDGGSFDWNSILNNDDFKDTFGNLTEVSEAYKTAYDDFIYTVSKSPTDIEACQEAFNNLATAYINDSNALEDLNEDTAYNTILQLKQMGVVNAEEAVYEALSKKLAQVQIQQMLLSGNPINTAESMEQLLTLAKAAGATESTIADLTNALFVLQNPKLRNYPGREDALNVIQGLTDGTYEVAFNPLFSDSDLEFDGESFGDNAKNTFTELFDFFDRRLEVLQNKLDLLDAGMENVFGAEAKNSLLSRQAELLQTEQKEYRIAAQMYDEMANQYLSKLDAELQQKIQHGAVDIDALVGEHGEEINENISGYVEWANKAQECRKEIESLSAELRQVELDKFNNIVDDYTSQFDLFGQGSDLIEQQIGLLETMGQVIPESFYNQQKSLHINQQQLLKQQLADMEDQLKTSIGGGLQKGSAEWLEMVNAIEETKGKIVETTDKIEELDNAILQLHWDEFDLVQNRFNEISSEAENLMELLNDSLDLKVSDGQGTYTDDAITALGLYAQQYEIAKTSVQDYEKAISELTQMYEDGQYSTTEYYEKLSDLTQGKWDAVNAAEAVEDAIMDLARSRVDEEVESINEEIDAYRKLIDAQLDAIQTEEDLRQKKEDITEASKEVSKIERQLAAMQYDTSAKANAERKLLEEQLAEAKKNLADIEHDYSIKEQQDALNKQMENFEEARNDEIKVLEESLNDREKLINEAFDLVKQNSISVGEAIETIAKGNGITVSQALVDAWKSGETAITGYGQTLTEQSSVFSGVLSSVKGEVIGLQTEAEKTYKFIADTFALNSEKFVEELKASYTPINELEKEGGLLYETVFNTLSGKYDVTGLVNAIGNIKDAFTGEGGLSDALQQIIDKLKEIFDYGKTESEFPPETPSPDKSHHKFIPVAIDYDPFAQSIGGNPGSAKTPILAIATKAKGGLVTKDDNNPLNAIARAVGEDTIVAAKEGESILTPIQTEAMLKLAPYLNRMNDLISSPAAIDRYRNDIITEGNKSIGNNIQVGSLVTVNGNVDDNNLKKLTEVVRKEINTTFTKWNRDFVYGGY